MQKKGGQEGKTKCILFYHIKLRQLNSCTVPALIHTGKKEEKGGKKIRGCGEAFLFC